MPYVPIKIDLNEKFEHLPHAPINEAVLQIRGPATSPWKKEDVTGKLKEALPDYPKTLQTQQFKLELVLNTENPVDGQPLAPASTTAQGQWSGLRLTSEDGKKIATFDSTAFSHSILRPYSDWTSFSGEALRLWEIHQSIAKVEQIQRLGLRFINQIELPPSESLDIQDYLSITPPDPKGITLPFMTFTHQDLWVVPEYYYQINCIRTMRPLTSANALPTLYIDLDVSTMASPVSGDIETKLNEMRWLKNKLFFGMITDKTLALLR